jgi:hypothetical protein
MAFDSVIRWTVMDANWTVLPPGHPAKNPPRNARRLTTWSCRWLDDSPLSSCRRERAATDVGEAPIVQFNRGVAKA